MLKRIGGMVPLEFSISTRKYNQLFNNMGTVYFYNSLIYINIDKEFLPGIISIDIKNMRPVHKMMFHSAVIRTPI